MPTQQKLQGDRLLKGDEVARGGVAAVGGLAAAIIPVLGAAAVVDPILVLVTPEMDWIEIDRWYE